MLPVVTATISSRVFFSLSVFYSEMKPKVKNSKVRNLSHKHSTQWFCSESPFIISSHCKIGGIRRNVERPQTTVCCVDVFSWQQNGTFRGYRAVVTDSPVRRNHWHTFALVWNKQGREDVGGIRAFLGVCELPFIFTKWKNYYVFRYAILFLFFSLDCWQAKKVW